MSSGSTQVESWYVATENGAVEYGIDALKVDIELGRVHGKSLVWRKGMQNWVELDQVPLLRMLVAVDAHADVHSGAKSNMHATAPTSTAIFDDLFEEKTSLFIRQPASAPITEAESVGAAHGGSQSLSPTSSQLRAGEPVSQRTTTDCMPHQPQSAQLETARAPFTRAPTPRISIPSALAAPAPKISPLRAEGHLPIPTPPPLRTVMLVAPTQTQEVCAKAPPTRAEARLPIPTPPPLLVEAAMVVPPTAAQLAAPKDAPEESSASKVAVHQRVSEDEQPALKALTALTQHGTPASTPPAPELPSRAEPAGTPAHAKSKPTIDRPSVSEPARANDALSDSIYPSISSIQPGLLRAHPSKRTIVIAASLTVAAAATIFIATTATPNEKAPAAGIERSDVAGARERNAHVGSAAIRATTNALPEAVSHDTVEKAPAATQANSGLARNDEPAPLRAARTPKKASTPVSVSAKSPRASGSTATGKPRASEPPIANSGEPVAAWEEGPVEKRPWMAPGF